MKKNLLLAFLLILGLFGNSSLAFAQKSKKKTVNPAETRLATLKKKLPKKLTATPKWRR